MSSGMVCRSFFLPYEITGTNKRKRLAGEELLQLDILLNYLPSQSFYE